MYSLPQVDEHLAKFPPIESPRIGGNFEVDENVLAGKKITYELFVYIQLIKARVIPCLLRPLQSNGRNIKPCLVHGNLWDGNTATDLETGEPFIFDPISFYAHNEYEIGNLRAPRHRVSSKIYVRQYQRNFPISEPEEDWDARNFLYSLTYNTSAAILYPAMKQRDAIFEGMKDLCFRFCRDELLVRLQGDTVSKQIKDLEDNINEEEEEEEEVEEE